MSRSRVLTIVLCTYRCQPASIRRVQSYRTHDLCLGKTCGCSSRDTLRKGFADEPEQASFKWDGTRHTRIGGGMSDIVSFTVHRFEGRAYVIQSAAARRPNVFEYAVAYKLTEGVYQVTAIDED